MIAIIGGSGLSQLSGLQIADSEVIRTPYGDPSAALAFGTCQGTELLFLARHGAGHTIPPHEINYRANMWALKSRGVSRILSIATVGGIAPRYVPGALVIPHQIIDYTWGRSQTFFNQDEPVRHIDFTEPFSKEMKIEILAAAASCGETVFSGAVYAVTQGPRLETAAEINRLERDGADLVGMTAMPEAALARELDISYGTLALVANFAAGRGDSLNRIDLDAIHEVHQKGIARIDRVINSMLGALRDP